MTSRLEKGERVRDLLFGHIGIAAKYILGAQRVGAERRPGGNWFGHVQIPSMIALRTGGKDRPAHGGARPVDQMANIGGARAE